PAKWFDDRAQEPQLGLYWLAQHDVDPVQPVRAVAYAQLRPGEMKAVGLADWRAVENRWRHTLEGLAVGFREGVAAVAPRDVRATCKRCGRQSLCRIGIVSI